MKYHYFPTTATHVAGHLVVFIFARIDAQTTRHILTARETPELNRAHLLEKYAKEICDTLNNAR